MHEVQPSLLQGRVPLGESTPVSSIDSVSLFLLYESFNLVSIFVHDYNPRDTKDH